MYFHAREKLENIAISRDFLIVLNCYFLGYIVEMKSKFDPNFVKAVEVTGNTCKAKVPKLEEGNQYQFRVRAVNKAGPGEASEPTLPHIAKPRFCKYWHLLQLINIISLFLYQLLH